jgi:hypothetical protein
VPFVLLVDPTICARKEDFLMLQRNDYKYYMIGGNHSTCAKMDLAGINPKYDALQRVQARINPKYNALQKV